jgi:hypothetical protein
MSALAAAHDTTVQMIDTSIVRVHQHAARALRQAGNSTKTDFPKPAFDNITEHHEVTPGAD